MVRSFKPEFYSFTVFMAVNAAVFRAYLLSPDQESQRSEEKTLKDSGKGGGSTHLFWKLFSFCFFPVFGGITGW